MGKQIQVVDALGQYQESSVVEFVEHRNLSNAGVHYSTVAIMGPQSSGKSTLLNALVRVDESALLAPNPQWHQDSPTTTVFT
jgi:ABC-type lipoprotein export system ATPase subunit